jgi:hypothetical protein
MSYLDRAKKWCSNEEIKYAAKYLKENKHLITPNEMSDLYFNAPDNTTTSVMTAILLDSGINPLKYLPYVPEYYGYGLFIGDLILPKHIRVIGENAFANCDIESVHIPEGAYLIEYQAFYRCHHLSEIYLPSSITVIKERAFAYDDNLVTIKYNGTIEEYADIDHNPDSTYYDIDTPIHLICTDREDTI